MTQDVKYPEEANTQHYCYLLRMRANYLREQARLLEKQADELMSTICFCSELEDATNGRR